MRTLAAAHLFQLALLFEGLAMFLATAKTVRFPKVRPGNRYVQLDVPTSAHDGQKRAARMRGQTLQKVPVLVQVVQRTTM